MGIRENDKIARVSLAVVASVYNEVEGLRAFNAKLLEVLNKMDVSFEVIFVNDGSRDGSDTVIE
ncbi:MAG: glycosyltransferase, partial [Bacteroidales bacterium]